MSVLAEMVSTLMSIYVPVLTNGGYQDVSEFRQTMSAVSFVAGCQWYATGILGSKSSRLDHRLTVKNTLKIKPKTYSPIGRAIVNAVPSLRLLSTEIVPPCSSTIDLAMASPSPDSPSSPSRASSPR